MFPRNILAFFPRDLLWCFYRVFAALLLRHLHALFLRHRFRYLLAVLLGNLMAMLPWYLSRHLLNNIMTLLPISILGAFLVWFVIINCVVDSFALLLRVDITMLGVNGMMSLSAFRVMSCMAFLFVPFGKFPTSITCIYQCWIAKIPNFVGNVVVRMAVLLIMVVTSAKQFRVKRGGNIEMPTFRRNECHRFRSAPARM